MIRRTDLLYLSLPAAPRNRGYPLLAALLLLYLFAQPPVEQIEQQEPRSVAGLRGDGVAYDCTTLAHRGLLEFCVFWTREVR